jgi:hypothetical protein
MRTTCPAHLTFLNLFTLIITVVAYKLWYFSLCNLSIISLFKDRSIYIALSDTGNQVSGDLKEEGFDQFQGKIAPLHRRDWEKSRNPQSLRSLIWQRMELGTHLDDHHCDNLFGKCMFKMSDRCCLMPASCSLFPCDSNSLLTLKTYLYLKLIIKKCPPPSKCACVILQLPIYLQLPITAECNLCR